MKANQGFYIFQFEWNSVLCRLHYFSRGTTQSRKYTKSTGLPKNKLHQKKFLTQLTVLTLRNHYLQITHLG